MTEIIELEKPILIEKSFIAPIYSLEIHKKINDIIPLLDCQKLADFLSDTLKLNNKLFDIYGTKSKTNIIDAITSCFVKNQCSSMIFVHYYLRAFSMNNNYRFIYDILKEWYASLCLFEE